MRLEKAVLRHGSVDEIRIAEEARDEAVHRQIVDLLRRADLLQDSLVHYRQAVGHAQRLLPVMGNVYRS